MRKNLIAALLVAFMTGMSDSPAMAQQSHGLGNSQSISLEVRGMDIIEVLKILSDKGGLNLSISGNATGRVTLFLKDVGLADAFDIVLMSGGLAYERKGDIIYIMPERDYELKYGSKYWDEKQMQVFHLENARASRVREVLAVVASNNGKVIVDEPTNTLVVIDAQDKIARMRELIDQIDKRIQTRVFDLNYLPAEQIVSNLEGMLTSEVGSVRMDEMSNKVVVTDYPERIREVAKLIKAFDEKPQQVLIDAKIIQIKPSRAFYSGINWDFWFQKYFQLKGNFSIPLGADESKMSVGTVSQGTDALEKGSYRSIVEFLETFGKTKILSTPRILTLNNQEAKIMVGTRQAYITSTIAGVGEDTITSNSVNFVDVGVKLFVTPTINSKGFITLKIKPEISDAEPKNIRSEDKVTEVPIVSTSEAETTVMVKDGVGIILGGLRKVTSVNQRKQVPVLGNVPLLGKLFASEQDSRVEDELVIILTPRLVSGEQAIEQELEQRMQKRFEAAAVEGMEPETETLFRSMLERSRGEPLDPRQEYMRSMAEKIRASMPLYEKTAGVTVRVRFRLSQFGELEEEPEAVTYSAHEYWRRLASQIIREAAPFDPFPNSMSQEQETFEIDLTL
jgi:type II secretory pathway component GspD/PulD (secretin)